MVNRSKEALPVLKIFGYAGAGLVAMGSLGINFTISSVQTVVKEDMDKKFVDMKTDMDKKFEGLAKDFRYFALVSSERLAVVESKLGVPRGSVTLPPPSREV
jgi:hypothetical protein